MVGWSLQGENTGCCSHSPGSDGNHCLCRTQGLERFRIEDQYVGSLVGVEYAEAFKARSPLLVAEPTVFLKTPFG